MSDPAHDVTKPMELRLSELINGEGAEIFWIPQTIAPEQFEARAKLAEAIAAFEDAFGTSALLQQLRLWGEATRSITLKNRAQKRILEARADINLRAAAARARGDEAGAEEIEAEPTPDYPEREQDERELGAVHV